MYRCTDGPMSDTEVVDVSAISFPLPELGLSVLLIAKAALPPPVSEQGHQNISGRSRDVLSSAYILATAPVYDPTELSRPDWLATVQSGRKQVQSRVCMPSLTHHHCQSKDLSTSRADPAVSYSPSVSEQGPQHLSGRSRGVLLTTIVRARTSAPLGPIPRCLTHHHCQSKGLSTSRADPAWSYSPPVSEQGPQHLSGRSRRVLLTTSVRARASAPLGPIPRCLTHHQCQGKGLSTSRADPAMSYSPPVSGQGPRHHSGRSRGVLLTTSVRARASAPLGPIPPCLTHDQCQGKGLSTSRADPAVP